MMPMRKWLWLLLALPAGAQVSTPSVVYQAAAPSGACVAAAPILVVKSTGVLYTCNNGTWASGGGGGGSPGGSSTDVQYNNAGAFAGSSALTFNSSTGGLTISNNTSSPLLTMKDLGGANVAAIDMQGGGTDADDWNLVAGAQVFAGGYFYLFDATANNVPIAISTSEVQMGSGEVLGFSSGAGAGTAGLTDTGVSRASAGLVKFGNGTAGNDSGTIDASHFQVGGVAGVTKTCTSAIVVVAGIITGCT